MAKKGRKSIKKSSVSLQTGRNMTTLEEWLNAVLRWKNPAESQ